MYYLLSVEIVVTKRIRINRILRKKYIKLDFHCSIVDRFFPLWFRWLELISCEWEYTFILYFLELLGPSVLCTIVSPSDSFYFGSGVLTICFDQYSLLIL